MRKMFFITLTGNDLYSNGINKKVSWQIKAFQNSGFDVFNSYFEPTESAAGIKYNGRVVAFCKHSVLMIPFLRIIAAAIIIFILAKKIMAKNGFELIYVRKNGYIEFLLSYLFKKTFPNVHILLEIPTYPYRAEFTSKPKDIFFIALDTALKALFCNNIDNIVTFSNHNKIWGRNAIKIGNGYCFENLSLPKKKKHECLIFTAVAGVSNWHGLDRFLHGMRIHRLPYIVFNIVGDGPSIADLKDIVEQDVYLKESVNFLGRLGGEALKNVYSITDIGVGSLGRHRCGIKQVQPLKNREYIAMGLPLLFSTPDALIPWHLPFVYRISDDETPVDIDKVVAWYNSRRFDPENIFLYGKNNLTWDKQIQIIINEHYDVQR